MSFANCYEDSARAEAYATLEFKNTHTWRIAISRPFLVPMFAAAKVWTSVAAPDGPRASCVNSASRLRESILPRI